VLERGDERLGQQVLGHRSTEPPRRVAVDRVRMALEELGERLRLVPGPLDQGRVGRAVDDHAKQRRHGRLPGHR
jgi:hypothetical protein